MNKNKKNLIIAIFLVVILAFASLLVFIISKNLKEDDSVISNIEVNTDDINVSIFEAPETDVIENKDEEINYGDASVNIDGEDVKISLGSMEILRKSYVHLTDEYYLIEALIARKEDLPVRSDKELSTSYDNCLFYAKKWFLYNEETKNHYLVEDNTLKNELSLNPKITTEDDIKYFEFDKMFNYAQLTTDVNHYKIELSEFISVACSGQGIDFSRYSTVDVPTFSSEDEVASVETSKDLNGDGKADSITLKVYSNYNDYNKCGYALKINDAVYALKDYGTLPVINFIDIDKNDSYTEILLSKSDEDSEDSKHYEIYYYDGNNIKLVFSGFWRGFSIETKDTVNEISLGDGNGELIIPCIDKDTTQNWSLEKKYKLDKNHNLYEVKPTYYQNTEEQIVYSSEQIVLYNSMNSKDVSDTILHEGQEVIIKGTSLDYWLVVGIGGTDYFIQLDKTGRIFELDLYPFDVFKGLNLGD